jgi:3-hydroxyisobutyrate dehydrogenase-like beta-hydroxyacid dehydrogenase
VSGSKKPAIDGQLIFLCAGDEALYKECESAFDVMGKAHYLFGAVGAGARMKLIVNMVMGSMMCTPPPAAALTMLDIRLAVCIAVALWSR